VTIGDGEWVKRDIIPSTLADSDLSPAMGTMADIVAAQNVAAGRTSQLSDIR
jgi:hypothetical protein